MRPLVLVIMDGWGLSPEIEGNAIWQTPTPTLDKLIATYPFASLHASGQEVGLEWGEMGNSEVGHLNLGTGRVVMQDLTRINKTVVEGGFLNNTSLLQTFDYAEKNESNLHLIGLYSSGGVHSHMEHLFQLLKMAKIKNFTRVCIHLISDGRDTAPKIITKDLEKLNAFLAESQLGQICSVMGRYWAMDRDKHMDRTEKAYNCIIGKNTELADDAISAISEAYKFNQTDEFIMPTKIKDTPSLKAKDAVIFYNFRADRSRQLSQKIIDHKDIFFTSFTSYGYEPSPFVKVAFITPKLTNQLGYILQQNKLSQLHMAETEKYAHVTYFFNGGWEQPYDGEKRILVESPKVATYDLKPDMSAKELTDQFISNFTKEKPVFTVLNYANPDMVGHTGDLEATKIAIKTVDENLGKLAATVFSNDADLLIVADHGNAEQMINLQTKEIDKEHSTNPVPFIICTPEKKKTGLNVSLETKIAWSAQPPVGVLADVTATISSRLGLTLPREMTGQSLTEVL